MENNNMIRAIEQIAASNKDKQQKTDELNKLKTQIRSNKISLFEMTMASTIDDLNKKGEIKTTGADFLEKIKREINK